MSLETYGTRLIIFTPLGYFGYLGYLDIFPQFHLLTIVTVVVKITMCLTFVLLTVKHSSNEEIKFC